MRSDTVGAMGHWLAGSSCVQFGLSLLGLMLGSIPHPKIAVLASPWCLDPVASTYVYQNVAALSK